MKFKLDVPCCLIAPLPVTTIPTKLEREVMMMLLAGEHPALEILRHQFALCSIIKREFSGVGFFTTFSVPESAPGLPNRDSFYFGDVDAKIPSLQYGAGFVLRIREGTLDFLEAFTYDETWPEHADDCVLQYAHTPRDLRAVLGR